MIGFDSATNAYHLGHSSLVQFAKEVGFGNDLQSGIYWVLTPFKQGMPSTAGDLYGAWHTVSILLEPGHVGYLDLRVVVVDLLVLLGCIVVIPVMCARKSSDIQQFGFVTAIVGVVFGLTVFGYNLIAWPFPVSAVWLRMMPLAVTIGLVVIAIAGVSARRRRVGPS